MIKQYSYTCRECGITKTFELREEDVNRWKAGALIQNVFPKISIDDRELMISQTCGACFDKLFSEED